MEYKRYFAVLILGIFLISLASAEVFTFDNVKTYDEELKKVTITSILSLKKLADVQLTSDLVQVVPMGDSVMVANFTLYNYGDYQLPFNDMDFYDRKKGDEEFYRYYEYKYLTTECKIVMLDNYTIDRKTKLPINNGKYEYNHCYETWKKLDINSELKEGTYTIGIFTQVKYGDYVEWIPTLYGKRVKEWAEFVQSSGTETTDGDYTVFTFTSNGYFNTTNDLSEVQILVVAGGGGGGGGHNVAGGAGGAGGVIWNNTNATLPTGNYLIEVGSGGARGDAGSNYVGFNGSNSVFGNDNFKMTAIAGGAGGSGSQAGGSDGGSGGASGNWGKKLSHALQNSVNGTGYGYYGGNGSSAGYGGGGGGATSAGENVTGLSKGGDGGNGLLTAINGTSFYVGAGGGGSNYYGSGAGNPGTGGDGTGGDSGDGGNATSVGAGGGGGSGANRAGGAGADGIVIVRYLTPEGNSPPNVILNSPANHTNYSVSSVTFNVTVTDDIKVENVSLLIDGSVDQTNTSNYNGTYIFTKSLSTGWYNWSILAFDNSSQSNQSEYRYFNITIASPSITLYTPADNLYTSNASVWFVSSVTDDFELENVSLWIDGVRHFSNLTGIQGNYSFYRAVNEGTRTWYFKAYDNDSNPTDSSTRTLYIDRTNPTINVTIPQNTTYYTSNYTDTNLTSITFNWTSSDTNLDMCWYDNGSINIVSCNTNQSLSVPFTTYNYRFFANDSANNTHSDLRTPSYASVYFENAHTYNPTTTETFSETFTLNITLGTGVTLNSAYFNYNGTTYSPSISTNGNKKILTKSISIPDVANTQNATFFWTLNSNQVSYNTTELNQTISPLVIDNCSANTIPLINYTIYDEGTRTQLPAIQNTTSDIIVRLGGDVSGVEYKQYNLSTTSNPFTICVNASLGSQNYRLNTEVQYKADDYVTEYHYLNNYTMNSSVQDKNISLYLLQSTDSQEFLITYKNKYDIPTEGIYIELWRQYLDIGKHVQVEVSKTDNDGRTIGHFVLNDEIYNVYGYEEDTRDLKFFYENVRAFCIDLSTGDCQIEVKEQTSYANPDSFITYRGIVGSENYDTSTNTYTFSFTSEDDTARKVNLTIRKYDTALNDVVCSEEDTATSGTFTCVIPAAYYNSSVLAEIYVDDGLYSTNIFYVSSFQDQGLGTGGFILAFLLVITIPLLALGSGPMVLIFFLIGLFLAGGLFLVNLGGFIGAFSAFLWLAIAAIILLIKAARRKEQ